MHDASRTSAAAGVVVLSTAAVWLHGLRSPEVLTYLAWTAFGWTLVWVLSLVVSRRRPDLRLVPTFLLALPLLAGAFLCVNASHVYDAVAATFVETPQRFAGLPGALDAAEGWRVLLATTAAACVFVMACDAAGGRNSRRFVLVGMAVNVLALVAFGLLQKAGFFEWVTVPQNPRAPFASFDYHGNAASLMLLGLGLVAASLPRSAVWARSAGLAGSALVLVGLAVNISKAGLVLGVAAVLGLLLLTIWRGSRDSRAPSGIAALAAGAGLLGVVLAVGLVAGNWQRVRTLVENPGHAGGRLVMWKITGDIAAERQPFGHGPGSFKLLHPVSQHFDPRLYPRWIVTRHEPGTWTSIWSYAHNDPLQGLVEWGVVGTISFGIVLLGAVGRGFMLRGRHAVPAGCLAVGLLAVLIHSLVDWPLQVPAIQMPVAAVAGLLWSLPRDAEAT